jgi:hypothetical protein
MAEKKPAFKPTVVHAYRRQPHLEFNPRTNLHEEKGVEVEFKGEKALFKSNDAGHVVAEIKTEALFKRLVDDIPEAYIAYQGGENLPTERVLASEHKQEVKPKGAYVLQNGDEYVVLDTMDDEAVRDFATDTAGIEPEALPAVLTGEALKKAVFNQLKTD